MSRKEVETQFPEEYASWESDPFTFAPQGGESGISVLARALPVIREIVVGHTDKNIVVVSHKATIRLVLSSLLGFDERGANVEHDADCGLRVQLLHSWSNRFEQGEDLGGSTDKLSRARTIVRRDPVYFCEDLF